MPFVCYHNGEMKLRAEWNEMIDGGDVVLLYRLHSGDLEDIVDDVVDVIDDIVDDVVDAIDEAIEDIFQELLGTPDIPTPARQGEVLRGSPTYSLQAQGNTARLGSPIPVIYGRQRVFPDYGAIPYRKYFNGDQYSFQFFVIGQGEYDITDVKIGDTLASDFDEDDVEVRVMKPRPGSSRESTDSEALNIGIRQRATGATSQAPSPRQTTSNSNLRHTLAQMSAVRRLTPMRIGSDPSAPYRSIDREYSTTSMNTSTTSLCVRRQVCITRSQVRQDLNTGVCAVTSSIRCGMSHADGTKTDWVTYQIADPEFQYQPYHLADIGGWSTQDVAHYRFQPYYSGRTFGDAYISAFDNQPPPRLSIDIPLENFPISTGEATGEFAEYRFRRKFPREPGSAYRDEIEVERVYATRASYGARRLGPQDGYYPDYTTMLVIIRAGKVISDLASRKISVLAQRKLPIYDAESQTWSEPTATRNPAWAIADIFRAKYGLQLPDEQLDLDNLMALAQVYDDRDDYFDGVFDSKITAHEALNRVARTGRATTIGHSGVYRMVRDAKSALPVAMFTPSNMTRGSFRINYRMAADDEHDGVRLEYLNSETNYLPDFISVNAEGGTPTNPRNIKFFGCTDRAMAVRESAYLARKSAYRRRTVRFTTELEGNIPSYGDLITISHDMPSWGQSGEIVSAYLGPESGGVGFHNSQTIYIKLSEPIDLTPTEEELGTGRTPLAKAYLVLPDRSEAQTHILGVDDHEPAIRGGIPRVPVPNGFLRVSSFTDTDGRTYRPLPAYFLSQVVNESIRIRVLGTNSDLRIHYGDGEERSRYLTRGVNPDNGQPATAYALAVVKNIKSKGNGQVEISAIIEDDRVHEDA